MQLPDDTTITNYALTHGRPFTFDRRESALSHAMDNLAALFAKEVDNRQLDFLKARGFPKGLTDLLLSPDRLDQMAPSAVLGASSSAPSPGKREKRPDPTPSASGSGQEEKMT